MMKKIMVIVLMGILFFPLKSLWADNNDIKDFSFVTASSLRVACKEAIHDYSNQPEKLANTKCGAFIQGYILGTKTGLLEGIPKDGTDKSLINLKEKAERWFCHRNYGLRLYIQDYLLNASSHPDFKGSASDDLVWALSASCENFKNSGDK